VKLAGAAMVLIFIAALCAGCGGGGGGGGGNTACSAPAMGTGNVQPIAVNLGPVGNYVNGVFTSVKVCIPGTSKCRTVDDVLVDTGSYGLRILNSQLKLALPHQTDKGGNPVGECAFFVDFFTWGPVDTADVQIAGEIAPDVPVQVIGASGFPSPPSDCTSVGTPAFDTLAALGAKGILGIGVFAQDCGTTCESTGPANPGLYYSCPSSGCTGVTAEAAQNQVQNPVPLFPSDNNGVIVHLPAVGASGSSTACGSLLFGIGTSSNNSLGNATVLTADDFGNFTTIFKGISYSQSFIDSGSNALFFLDSATSGIRGCANAPGFYCPSSSLRLKAQNMGANSASRTTAFGIANADQLFSTGNAAFNNLGGTNPGAFDWGLPFFFGRKVFVAIDGQSTPGGPGPYWAY
jgi:Protein of unknown function (DUF3443)